MLEVLLIVAVLVLVIALLVMQRKLPAHTALVLEQQHRAMLVDLHDGLNKQGDRLIAAQTDQSERLRAAVADDLRVTRDALHAMRNEMLTQTLEKLAEQGREDQKLIQDSFRNATQHSGKSLGDYRRAPAFACAVVSAPTGQSCHHPVAAEQSQHYRQVRAIDPAKAGSTGLGIERRFDC